MYDDHELVASLSSYIPTFRNNHDQQQQQKNGQDGRYTHTQRYNGLFWIFHFNSFQSTELHLSQAKYF